MYTNHEINFLKWLEIKITIENEDFEKPELITLRNLRTLRTLRITTSKKSTHTVNNLNSSPYATYASQQVHRH